MLGKLLDGHHIGVLRDGERILLLGLHEVEVLLVRILTLLLSLVDLQKVCVHAAHYDAVVNHTRFVFNEFL